MKRRSQLEEAWYQATLKNYESRLMGHVMRLLKNKELSQDIVQDAFLKLWNEDFSKIQNRVGPWLFRVSRNRAIDHLRATGRLSSIEDEGEQILECGENLAPWEGIKGIDLLDLIDKLPIRQQEVILLKFKEGLTHDEISEIIGLSASHVGVIVFRALKALKALLEIDNKEAVG
jgi:RNA polymerase sigma factor (sigma-70 family)